MAKTNKEYCKELLENDDPKAVLNGVKAIKEQITENNKEIGKLVASIATFEELEDSFTVERLQKTLTIKENWNKSLEYYLPQVAVHYNDIKE